MDLNELTSAERIDVERDGMSAENRAILAKQAEDAERFIQHLKHSPLVEHAITNLREVVELGNSVDFYAKTGESHSLPTTFGHMLGRIENLLIELRCREG
jgi:hypothetical protein